MSSHGADPGDIRLLETLRDLTEQKRSLSEEWDHDIEEDTDIAQRRDLDRINQIEELERQIEIVLDGIGFTRIHISPQSRRTAVSEYLARFKQKASPGNIFIYAPEFGPEELFEMTVYYTRKKKLDHAAATYEYLDGIFHEGLHGIDLSSYLPEMITVYTNLEDLPRLRELAVRAKDAFYAGVIDKNVMRLAESGIAQVAALNPMKLKQQDVEELASSYSTLKDELENELENAKFEIARLRGGVLLNEERLKANEWFARHHENLALTADSQQTLIDAVMCCGKRELRDQFRAWIPILIGKAIEAEFNSKIWQDVPDKYRKLLFTRYTNPLSINQIHDFLAGSAGRSMETAVRKEILDWISPQLRHNDLVKQDNLERLSIIREHSTEARHGHYGQRQYSRSRLDQFVKTAEMDKETGWIYRFLSLFSK